MTIQEAIQARHSVRQYIDKSITEDVVAALKAKIDEVNAESGLHIQLILNEPKSFQCAMAKYGRFFPREDMSTGLLSAPIAASYII